MSGPDCPPWCLPTVHNKAADVHVSAPVVVATPAARFVLHLESATGRPPYLTISQFSEPVDDTDEPSFEPDNLLVLKLAAGAELAAGVTSLLARALGGDR